MAYFVKKALQLIPNQLMYQQKRYRGKINVRKPKIYYKKAVLNELLTPFFANPNDKTLEQFCAEVKSTQKKKPLTPYEVILTREIRNWFDKTKMIALLHVNSISELDKFDVKVLLHRENMYYKYYGPRLVLEAIKNSPYESIVPLIGARTAYVFSSEMKATALQKILKKSKKMYALGGVLEGQVLKIDEFMKYGAMDITAIHLSLVQILQSAGVNLNQHLMHHPSTLVTRLKQIGTKETTDEKQ
ncbi:39S ribosomal protein L10, mitochondrial [Anthophora quadrimaculata]